MTTQTIAAASAALPSPALMTIQQAGAYISLSRATLYELIRHEKIEAVKAGTRILVRVPSLKAYAASLPPAKIAPRAKPRKVTYQKRSKRK